MLNGGDDDDDVEKTMAAMTTRKRRHSNSGVDNSYDDNINDDGNQSNDRDHSY